MLKEEILQLAGDIRGGQVADPRQIADRLVLVCLNPQESEIYHYLAGRAETETSEVCDQFGIKQNHAGNILLDLLAMGMVMREFKKGQAGRPRSVWKVAR